MPTRRSVLLGTAGAALSLPAFAGQALAVTDWSVEVVKSTMARFTPAKLGGWDYTRGLYLYGQYLVFKRTGVRAYLDYIKAWVDRFVDANGSIGDPFNSLDSMRSGVLLPILHAETGLQRYKTAADKIRNRFPGYPRTPDGAMIHNTGLTGQLWADGAYMAQPFIANYAKQYGQTYGFDESTRNLATYFAHLQATNGLMYHAYDATGKSSWAVPPANHSQLHWGRAIGWFAMATVDVLEVLPPTHPRRQSMIDIVNHLAAGLKRYQDGTGRWFQVVDRGTTSGNWTETSASSMFTYMLSRGVQRGYLDSSYEAVAAKGYQGVLGRISLGSDGRTTLTDICDFTAPGNSVDYYFGRPRKTNDFHGLGAFLIMNEQLTRVP